MTKKNILLVSVLALLMLTAAACGKKTTSVPTQVPNVQNEIQTPRGSEMLNVVDDGMYDPEENKENPEELQGPNALDYMAPGHRQARERIKQVQELRQQALDDQKKDLERLNSK